MAKVQRMQKTTQSVTGNISYISPTRQGKKGGEFVNIDIAVDGDEGTRYVQLTFSGKRGIGAYKGFRFDTETREWVKERSELTVGQLVTATGPSEIRTWKAKNGSKVSKQSISILNFNQIKVTVLPPAPWETKAKVKSKAKTQKKV
jgi:hypothetical protein